MKNLLQPLALGVLLTISVRTLPAEEWNAAPSYFTHDYQTGQRVNQFAPTPTVINTSDPTFVRSSRRQSRSSLQIGASIDHVNVVEEYGRQVRPYGEWRFPYRPYSTPYPNWGAPPNIGFGGGFGGGVGGGGAVAQPTPYGLGPFNDRTGIQPPYFDGQHPMNRIPPRLP